MVRFGVVGLFNLLDDSPELARSLFRLDRELLADKTRFDLVADRVLRLVSQYPDHSALLDMLVTDMSSCPEPFCANAFRIITHLDVSFADIEKALDTMLRKSENFDYAGFDDFVRQTYRMEGAGTEVLMKHPHLIRILSQDQEFWPLFERAASDLSFMTEASGPLLCQLFKKPSNEVMILMAASRCSEIDGYCKMHAQVKAVGQLRNQRGWILPNLTCSERDVRSHARELIRELWPPLTDVSQQLLEEFPSLLAKAAKSPFLEEIVDFIGEYPGAMDGLRISRILMPTLLSSTIPDDANGRILRVLMSCDSLDTDMLASYAMGQVGSMGSYLYLACLIVHSPPPAFKAKREFVLKLYYVMSATIPMADRKQYIKQTAGLLACPKVKCRRELVAGTIGTADLLSYIIKETYKDPQFLTTDFMLICEIPVLLIKSRIGTNFPESCLASVEILRKIAKDGLKSVGPSIYNTSDFV